MVSFSTHAPWNRLTHYNNAPWTVINFQGISAFLPPVDPFWINVLTIFVFSSELPMSAKSAHNLRNWRKELSLSAAVLKSRLSGIGSSSATGGGGELCLLGPVHIINTQMLNASCGSCEIHTLLIMIVDIRAKSQCTFNQYSLHMLTLFSPQRLL